MKGYTLLYYVFQHQQSTQYNICKIKTDSDNQGQIKMKQILKHFPFDALSGLYHFRFKSEFKENGENVIGWIDITNVNSKVPIFNGSVYVKVLKLKSPAYNKILTTERLQRIREPTPEKKPHHHSSSVSPPPVQKPIITSGKNTHSFTNLLDPVIESPSPIKKETPVGPNPPKSNGNAFLFNPSTNGNKPKTEQNIQKQQIQKQEPPKKFQLTPEQIIEQARQNWTNATLKEEGERQAAIEFDERVEKWGYTMKTRNNFRTLLVTVHQLWPFGKWQQVDLGKLLTDNQLKKYYKKAMLVFHPDQNQNTTHRQVYLAKRIFSELNAAFNDEIK